MTLSSSRSSMCMVIFMPYSVWHVAIPPQAFSMLPHGLLAERKRAEHSCIVPKGGMHHVMLHALHDLVVLHVAIEHALKLLLNHRKEVHLVHDAPTENDALWRQGDGDVH